jgi:hypothetical protein
MSAPRSVSGLTSESLVWVKVSHQPSTKSHAQGGNELGEAGIREVSGCNESEGNPACRQAGSPEMSMVSVVETVHVGAGRTLMVVM